MECVRKSHEIGEREMISDSVCRETVFDERLFSVFVGKQFSIKLSEKQTQHLKTKYENQI